MIKSGETFIIFYAGKTLLAGMILFQLFEKYDRLLLTVVILKYVNRYKNKCTVVFNLHICLPH